MNIDLIKCLDGETFENYTINEVFNYEDYDVLEKSHLQMSLPYYVHSNNNPDFKLKCKQTGKVFWVECKFLQEINLNRNSIKVKEEQYLRYKKLKEPVFYLYGIGLYAQVIEELYLIPIENMYEKRLFVNYLEEFEIPLKKIKNFNELLKLTKVFPNGSNTH